MRSSWVSYCWQTFARQFQNLLDHVLTFLVQDHQLAVVNEMSRSRLYRTILVEAETAMDLCTWGPPLNIFPLTDFGYGLIAYGAFGLMQTASFDRAEEDPFTDYLGAAGLDPRTIRAIGMMAGTAVLNAVTETCLTHRLPHTARIMMHASEQVSAGLSVPLSKPTSVGDSRCHTSRYQNGSARYMMLEHIFLQTAPMDVRTRLLKIASGLHAIRQMIRDAEKSGQSYPDFFFLFPCLVEQIQTIWTEACQMLPRHRDAVAARIDRWVDRAQNLFPTENQ